MRMLSAKDPRSMNALSRQRTLLGLKRDLWGIPGH